MLGDKAVFEHIYLEDQREIGILDRNTQQLEFVD